MSYVRRRRQRQESRARAVVDAYTEKMAVWIRQIERLESQPVRGWGERGGGREGVPGMMRPIRLQGTREGLPYSYRVRDIRTLIWSWTGAGPL